MSSTTEKARSYRRPAALVLVGLGIVGLGAASASQLTINPAKDVASGVATFAPCDADGTVGAAYAVAAGVNADGSKAVTDVTVSGIDATGCAGRTIDVALLDAAGTQLATATGTIGGATFTSPVTGATTNFAVTKVAVVIR